MKSRVLVSSIATLLGAGLLGSTALAAPTTWTAASSTDLLWDTGLNWSLGVKPTALDDAIFPSPIPNPGPLVLPGTITLGAGELANSLLFSSDYTLAGGDLTLTTGSVTVDFGVSAIISSTLTGAGGLTKVGNGTLTLGSANNYSGVTAINAGQLNVSSSANLGDASATNTLSFDGGILRTTASLDLGATRSVAIGVNGGTLSAQNGTTLTVSGGLTGSGIFTAAGGGTVLLSGNNAGFSGDSRVTSVAGNIANTTLRLNNSNSLTSGTVTVDAGVASVGGNGNQVDLAGATINSGVSVILNTIGGATNARASLFASSGATVWNGGIQYGGNGAAGLNAATGATLTVNGDLTEALGGYTGTSFVRGIGNITTNGTINLPSGSIARTESGTWLINSTGNLWVTTQLSQGTIKNGTNDALPVTSSLVMGQVDAVPATYDLNGFDQTVGSISVTASSTGTKTITNSSGSVKTFTVNNAGTSTYGTGGIGVITGALALNKSGFGTLNLPGTNTFSGGTTVTSGKLSIALVGGLGAGAVSILPGGTFETTFTGTYANAITLSGGTFSQAGTQLTLGAGGLNITADSTISPTTGPTASKLIAPAGTLSSVAGTTIFKTGLGDLQIAGAQPNLHSNWDVVSGYLELQNATAAGDGAITIEAGAEVVNSGVNIGNAITLNAGGIISANTNSTANYSGPITLTGTATAAVRFFQTVTTGNGFTISGNISGPGGLTVNSGSAATPSTLTLSGTNSFEDITVITNANILYTSPSAIAGVGPNVIVNSGAAAAAGYAIDQAFLGRIVNSSVGAVALGGVNSSNNLDFSAAGVDFSSASLGATGSATYTGTLTPNGTTYRLGGGNGTLTLPNFNALTGSNDLVVQNFGTVVLANSNNLSGTTTVNSGTLILAADNALGSSDVTVGSTMQIGTGGLAGSIGGGALTVNGTLNINRGDKLFTLPQPLTGTGTIQQATSGRTAITGGNIPRLTFNANGKVDVLSNPTSIGVDGAFLVQVTGGVYGEVNATGGGSLSITPNIAGNGGDVGAVAGGTLVVNAPITDGTGNGLDFISAGGGTVILNGANTFTGVSLIQNAVVVANSLNKVAGGTASSSLGAPTSVANGTISVGDGTRAASTLRYVGTGETTDRVINLAGTTSGAILDQSGGGVLGFSSNFTATGAGVKTLTLTGYGTGTGLISGAIVNSASATNLTKTGPVTWTLNGANTYTGTTTLGGGTLALNFSTATPTTNIISASSPLALSSGTLSLIGKASTTNSQTFASTAVNLGGTNVSLTANPTANPLLLSLGAITRNAGGTVNFTLPTGTQSATNGITTSTANGSGGILGGYATVGGVDWATKSGSNIVALTAYTAAPATGATSTVNYSLAGNLTATGATTFNSLKITDTAATQALALGANAMTFSGTAGGLMYAGGTSNGYTISGTGVIGAGSANEFIVQVPNAASSLTISAPVVSSSAAAGSLTKAGAGTLTLTAASAFTGSVNLTGGVTAAALTNTATTPFGGQLGTTYRVLNFTNNATYRATGTYNDNAPSATNTAFVFNFGLGGGTLDVGSTFTLTLDDGSGTGTASTNAQLQGSGDLTKTGAGTLSLGNGTSNFSNFTGRIFVNQGTLTVGGTSGGVSPFGSVAAGTYVGSGGTLLLAGSTNTAAEPLFLTGIGTAAGIGALSNAAGNSSVAGLTTLVGGASIGGAGNITMNSPIVGTGGLTKVGAGTLTLGSGNSYSGNTTVSTGTLALAKMAAVPTGSTYSVAAGAVMALNVGGNGEFQSADVLSHIGITTFANNTSVIALDTTNSPGGTFTSPVITGALGFGKAGTGTLVVPTSTYTGGTTIYGGTILTTADNALPATALNLGANGGAVTGLDLDTFDQSVSSLTVSTSNATASVIDIGVGKTLTVNGNVNIGNTVITGTTPKTLINFIGGGSLVVNSAGGTFSAGNNIGTTNNSVVAEVNLSALANFSANLGATGTFVLQPNGDNRTTGGTGTIVTLSNTANSITANALNIGPSATGVTHMLLLGAGTNAINANAINLGTGSRDSGMLKFAATGPGTAVLRNAAGTGRITTVTLGPTTPQGTAYTTASAFDTTGHSVDVAIATLQMDVAAKTAPNVNDFKFDTGTLDIRTVNMAVAKGTGASNSTLAISGGTVLLGGSAAFADSGTGSVTLATAATGELAITGGVVTSTVDILRGAATAGSSAVLTLNGGTLNMTGKNIGSAVPIDVLSFQSGTLQNVGQINNGAGLSKTTNGTLVLNTANSYSGGTSIVGGVLSISADASLGNAAGLVSISNGATLRAGADVTTNRIVTLSTVAGGKIDTNGNTVTLDTASTVVGTALEKVGTGTLNIRGNQSYDLTTTAGVTNIYTAIGSGTATVNANATTNFAVSETLGALNIGDGAVVTLGTPVPPAPAFIEAGFDAGADFSVGSVAVQGVPEPGAATLLLGGLLTVLGMRRRR